MLLAEVRGVQAHEIDREVVAEKQVLAAMLDPLAKRASAFLVADILGYVESPDLCFTVTIDPSG